MNLTKLLKPQTIAVVGASEKEGFGGDVCRNILEYTEDLSKVFFVNPKRDTVFGRPCFHTITDLPENIDLLILCTPQKTILPLLEEGAEKGCGGAVIFASGYGEVGTDEGRAKERQLLARAEELGIAVMGPNCAGYVNYIDNVQAFAFISEKRERKGNVGVVSQSGQLCLSMIDCPSMRFSYNISAGNAKGIQMEDYMEFLVNDKDTKVISLYIEGIKSPEKFVDVLKKAAQMKKPVVVLKAGRSLKGQAIAASHTGSLSGADASFDAMLKKFGAIRADDLEELMALSQLLSTIPELPKVPGFASMNLSGGETGICADVGYLNGILYPDFTETTMNRLKELLPDYATPNNPLDMTASLSYDAELYANALETVMYDPNIGMVLIGYTLLDEIADPAIHHMYEGMKKVVEKKGALCKPMALIPFAENTRNREYQQKLFEIGIPILPPPVYAFKILKKLSEYAQFDYNTINGNVVFPEFYGKQAYALSEHESKTELKQYGIPVADECILHSEKDIREAAQCMPAPWALKIESSDILHKSDVGGVILNVADVEAAENAYLQIMDNVKKNCPQAQINGILMTSMMKPGVEMILGVNNDPQFGPMLMIGMGGVFVEVFKDVAVSPAPVNLEEAMKMLKSLKAYRLLNGCRGNKKCDLGALCETIVHVSEFAAAKKDMLKELDINPLFVYPEGEGVGVADSLIVKYR